MGLTRELVLRSDRKGAILGIPGICHHAPKIFRGPISDELCGRSFGCATDPEDW